MCKDKAHGGTRCPNDNADARRRRRRAQKARTVHTARTIDQGELVQSSSSLKTMDDIKTEAITLSKLLNAPVNPDQDAQDKIDDELERRVTQIGLAIGEEADRRSGVSVESIQAQLDSIVVPGFDEASKGVAEAKNEKKRLFVELNEHETTFKETYPAEFGDAPFWAILTDEENPDYGRVTIPESLRNTDEFKEWKRLKEANADVQISYDAAFSQWRDKNEELEIEKKRIEEDAVKKVVEANRSVLSEIRPLGGDIPDNEFTDPAAIDAIRNTVGKDYPTAWLKKSADFGPLVVKTDAQRSNYNAWAEYESDNPEDVIIESKILMFRDSEARSIIEKMKQQPDLHVSSGRSIKSRGGDMVYSIVSKQKPFDPSTDEMGADGKPVGAGWHHGYIVSEDEEAPDYAIISAEKQWYKYGTYQGKEIPTVTVDINSIDNATGINYHEFAHRMERVSDNGLITRQEEAFLRRRTTDASGQRMKLHSVSPGGSDSMDPATVELGRDAGFANAYVGKEYLYSNSREVLAMGIESLFSKSHGSLIGLDKRKKDLDHRGFTLGIMATV